MLRFTTNRLLLGKLGNTRLGAEVLAQTRNDMKHLETSKTDNFVVRFLTRRRPIDFLAIEVDGPIAKELHPAFGYVKTAFSLLLLVPIFLLLVTNKLKPTYYLLVSTNILPEDKYVAMWEFSDWYVVLAGQLLLFLVIYDFSVYVRYPFFAYIVAPIFRKFNWVRPAPVANFTIEQLKQGVGSKTQARPLGRPINEVRKEMKQQGKKPAAPHAFGRLQPAAPPSGTKK